MRAELHIRGPIDPDIVSEAYVTEFIARAKAAALVERLEEHWREGDKHLQRHPAKQYKFERDKLYEDRLGRRRGQ